MNDILLIILLLSTPLLPMLLAFPAIHLRLPWFRYLAMLPAIIVVALPITTTIELPWLLLGTEMTIDNTARILLGGTILFWIAVTIFFFKKNNLPQKPKQSKGNYTSTFYLLMMGASFGAILSTDMVIFFVFSSIIGYSFYGLVITTTSFEEKARNSVRRAGRVYLVAIIIADIILFEALLIASLSSDSMSNSVVHQAIAEADKLTLYIWLVIIGFALKAGILPLHLWLNIMLTKSSISPLALILSSIPITISLVGILYWLPLGTITAPQSALLIQIIAGIAVIYAVVNILIALKKGNKLRLVTFQSIILMTGLFLLAIGAVLSNPNLWDTYQKELYLFVTLFGLLLITLFIKITWKTFNKNNPENIAIQADNSITKIEQWVISIINWLKHITTNQLPELQTWWQTKVNKIVDKIANQEKTAGKYEKVIQSWGVAITVFLVIAVLITIISMSSILLV